MSVKSEADFSLAQRMNQENSISLGAQITVREKNSYLFSESLLGIDDTILESINLNNGIECRENKVAERNDNHRKNDIFNYNNKNNEVNENNQSKDHNYNKSVDYHTVDNTLHPMLSWSISESAQIRMELEEVSHSTETSVCHNQPLNRTEADSGIEKSKWEDDSLLDQVFNNMESFNEDMETGTKDEKCAQITLENHFDSAITNNAGPFGGLSLHSTQNLIRKSSLPLNEQFVSSKKHCTGFENPEMKKDSETFYGLPNRVKSLIQRVKGIDELYGETIYKFFSTELL